MDLIIIITEIDRALKVTDQTINGNRLPMVGQDKDLLQIDRRRARAVNHGEKIIIITTTYKQTTITTAIITTDR